MKRYLTALFILLSILTVIIGLRIDVRWNGIVSWGLALILLIIAAYFTKYISDNKKQATIQGEKRMNNYAVFLPMIDPEKSQKFRQDHLDFLTEMRNQDRVLLFGRLTDGAGGLIIYQGNSLEEVEGWVKEDPYVKTEARGYKIHEWDMKTDYTISK